MTKKPRVRKPISPPSKSKNRGSLAAGAALTTPYLNLHREATWLLIGDLHMPFYCQDTLGAIIDAAAKLQPTGILQNGDLYDYFCFSRYSKSLDLMTPKAELDTGRAAAEIMWHILREVAPKARLIQRLGNHDARYTKRALDKLPEAYSDVHRSALARLTFDGVETESADTQTLKLDINGKSWRVHHGWLSGRGAHTTWFHENTIVGHSHSPHLLPLRWAGGTFWELNIGYAGDPTAPVFQYGATDVKKWTRSYGVIDGDGPRLVALE